MPSHGSASPDRSQPGIVRVPAWAAIPWLRAGFSTRQGGATTAYSADGTGEQNLGWTDADDPAIVAGNRRRFVAAATGEPAANLVTIRQVHGNVVQTIASGAAALSTPEGKAVLEGDGLITAQPGLLLGIQTADCVPILLTDTRTRAIAAFHAGWRGTLARIVEHGIAVMHRDFGSRSADLIAAIGPAIRPCCFAVGDEVRTHFEREFPYAPTLFSKPEAVSPPQTYMDLHEANRRQLLAAGLHPEAIALIAECTACTRTGNGRRKYFSHRAEYGFTGRMLSVIGIVDED